MTNRIFGLDVMRSMAILLVLLCHYSSPLYPFVSGWQEIAFNMMNWLAGYFGVEIFFVLSGFLIGTIYIKTQSKSEEPVARSVLTFLKRRWLRTLPNYYLFVLVNVVMLLTLGGLLNPASVVKSILFLQKVDPYVSLDFFGVSWSLAVEEWFYLLMPLSFLLIGLFIKMRRRALILSTFSLWIIPTVAKLLYCAFHPVYGDHEEVFRYGTFYRLDAIFFGVALAWAWSTERYRALIMRHKRMLLIAGLFLLLSSCAYAYLFLVKPVQNEFLYALYSPFCCIAIALCMPSLISVTSPRSAWVSRVVLLISTCSYSIYLAHVPVKQFSDELLRKKLSMDSIPVSLLYIFFMLAVTFSVSYFVYRNFELRILAYRDRKVHE